MRWKALFDDYLLYLKVERGLSANTLHAYSNDLERYLTFLQKPDPYPAPDTPADITLDHLQVFLIQLVEDFKLNDFSVARNIASLRSFHAYLELTNVVSHNPAQLLDLPKLHSKLPEILNVEEINAIISACDTHDPLGLRNRAIIEMLYSSGLRVSELVNLKIPNVYPQEGFLRIIGKGDKERLVPIGTLALEYYNLYLTEVRNHQTIVKGSEDVVFLNRRGRHLTREMILIMVKDTAQRAGISKTVSPHTFRHSFATHLIEAGADLIAVRDLLGHASISTTQIYLHTDVAQLRKVVDQYHPRKRNQ